MHDSCKGATAEHAKALQNLVHNISDAKIHTHGQVKYRSKTKTAHNFITCCVSILAVVGTTKQPTRAHLKLQFARLVTNNKPNCLFIVHGARHKNTYSSAYIPLGKIEHLACPL